MPVGAKPKPVDMRRLQRMLLQRKTTAEIAKRFGVSSGTIENRKRAARDKYGPAWGSPPAGPDLDAPITALAIEKPRKKAREIDPTNRQQMRAAVIECLVRNMQGGNQQVSAAKEIALLLDLKTAAEQTDAGFGEIDTFSVRVFAQRMRARLADAIQSRIAEGDADDLAEAYQAAARPNPSEQSRTRLAALLVGRYSALC